MLYIHLVGPGRPSTPISRIQPIPSKGTPPIKRPWNDLRCFDLRHVEVQPVVAEATHPETPLQGHRVSGGAVLVAIWWPRRY